MKKGSIVEANALGNRVSGKRSFAVDLQPVAGVALHDDFARGDRGTALIAARPITERKILPPKHERF